MGHLGIRLCTLQCGWVIDIQNIQSSSGRIFNLHSTCTVRNCLMCINLAVAFLPLAWLWVCHICQIWWRRQCWPFHASKENYTGLFLFLQIKYASLSGSVRWNLKLVKRATHTCVYTYQGTEFIFAASWLIAVLSCTCNHNIASSLAMVPTQAHNGRIFYLTAAYEQWCGGRRLHSVLCSKERFCDR